MSDPRNVATDDNRISAGDGAHQVVLKVEQPKESPWKQPAIYVAVLAFLVAFWADREARLTEYYAVDLEMKMSQAGLHPPPDPWGKLKGKNP